MLNTSVPGDPSPQNRRKSRRVKPVGDDVVTVYSGESRWPAIVVDESDGGFGIAVPPDITVEIGDSVRVTAHRTVLKAIVVSRADHDRGVRLGLRLE